MNPVGVVVRAHHGEAWVDSEYCVDQLDGASAAIDLTSGNAVDHGTLTSCDDDTSHARAAVASYPREILGHYFFSLCTHPRRKNIHRAVDAFALVSDQMPEMTYVVVGALDHAHQRSLTRQIADYGLGDRIRLFGFASDAQLAALFRDAAWLLYPSLYEGFGLPVLEAMASRCPVITSDNSSLPELVGDAALLVNAYDTEGMAHAMVEMRNLSELERKAMLDRAAEKASTLTWSKTASLTKEVLHGV